MVVLNADVPTSQFAEVFVELASSVDDTQVTNMVVIRMGFSRHGPPYQSERVIAPTLRAS